MEWRHSLDLIMQQVDHLERRVSCMLWFVSKMGEREEELAISNGLLTKDPQASLHSKPPFSPYPEHRDQ